MELGVLLAIAIGVMLILAQQKRAGGGASAFGYRRKPYLLSKAERSFYGVLTQAVGDKALIFSKVRVADVLAPQKGLNRSNWQQAFNKISAKHLDFPLCDPQDCAVKLAIELDDARHGAAKRQKRDAFLEQACKSPGLPLLRIRAARGYGVADIRQQVEAVLFPGQLFQRPQSVYPSGEDCVSLAYQFLGSRLAGEVVAGSCIWPSIEFGLWPENAMLIKQCYGSNKAS